MTYPPVPVPVPTRRERQRELNPLRYHPMVNPVHIPEPAQLDPRPRLSLKRLAAVGAVASVVSGIAWAASSPVLLAVLFP